MEQRRSDTEETFGSQDPPEAVSNQNSEEAPVPGGNDPGAQKQRDRTDDPGEESGEGGRPGGAGEDSQATGNPSNAG